MILLLPLLAIRIFGPSLWGPFLFDDCFIERHALRKREWRPAWMQGWGGDFRRWFGGWFREEVLAKPARSERCPLTWWTFQKNYDWTQDRTWSYHAVNFAIHAINMDLVFILALYGLPFDRALLAAAVFAVHPLQCQSVCYISGRFGMLSATFALISLIAFFQGSYFILPLTLYCGWSAKEDIVTMPLLTGALWWLTR